MTQDIPEPCRLVKWMSTGWRIKAVIAVYVLAIVLRNLWKYGDTHATPFTLLSWEEMNDDRG